MKGIPVHLLLVTSMLVFPNHGHTYIMGEDDRAPASESDMEIPAVRQIGVIDTNDGGFVTGLVTGGNCDVIVSVGHAAFYWEQDSLREITKGAPRGDGNLTFYPDPTEPNKSFKLRLVKSGYEKKENVGDDRHDWSVFRTDEPVYERCVQIEVRINAFACEGDLYFPAFHFDKRSARLIDKTCAVKDFLDHKLLIHDCDSKDGSSGAPLVCVNDDDIKVIGLNISGLTLKQANNPSIFGKRGEVFHYKHHKNFAITFHGEFNRALKQELQASRQRKLATSH